MKKVLALMLALVLVLALAACGGGEKKEEAPTEAEISAKSLQGIWVLDTSTQNGFYPYYAFELKPGNIAVTYDTAEDYEKNMPLGNETTWRIEDNIVIITFSVEPTKFVDFYDVIDEKTLKLTTTSYHSGSIKADYIKQ